MDRTFLKDEDNKGLVVIMSNLKDVNHKIALLYSSLHGEESEVDDNPDYATLQKHIRDAIMKAGDILGKQIASSYI